jgi:CPA2 family monovalent cation:H+ antiporter-2
MPVIADAGQVSLVFVELGAAVTGLAVLARLANHFGVSTIPLYLLGGLAFGKGGLVDLRFSEDVVHFGGEIGVLLLLFMLGLEYSGTSCVPTSALGCRLAWWTSCSTSLPDWPPGYCWDGSRSPPCCWAG